MDDIVVGIDRSEAARRAATTAAELASGLNANLHIVICAEKSKAVNVSVGGDSFRTDWLSEAQQYLDEVGRKLRHDSITTKVGMGDPAKTLCEEAERIGARMIVVGNRRVQGVSRVLGSVANEVLRNAPCDVMVANTFGS